MNKPSPAFKRKQYFLPNSSQPHMLISIEIIILVLLIISSATLYLLANRNLETTYLQAHLKIKNLQQLLLPVLVLTNILGLGLSAILLVFFTHRIAGPAYRLSVILKQIGQGNLAIRVGFRKNDELKELEVATAKMLTALQGNVQTLRQATGQIKTSLEMLETAAPALQAELASLRAEVSGLEQELAHFQLPDQPR